MKLYLAALGWIPDAPAGNRLRWTYPVDAQIAHAYLGLPEVIIVERAWVDEDLQQPGHGMAASYSGGTALPIVPYSWWDHFGDVHPGGYIPKVYTLPWSAQAVSFRYQGGDTRLVAVNRDGQIVADQMVTGGQFVALTAPDISALVVFAYSATFRDFAALDLCRDRGLPWEEIARIRVAGTVSLSLANAALRYDEAPTLSREEWAQLVEAAERGGLSDPASDAATPDEPILWAAFQMMMGIRWEHAVLFGHGFFDGPRAGWPDIDEVREDLLLPGVPSGPVAYRVREEAERVAPSNAVICPPWLAAPLVKPGVPIYESPQVRLTVEPDTGKPKFVATYKLRWAQPDPVALGVEIEEEIGASPSPTVASAAETLRYTCRTRQPDDPAGEGLQVRSQDVAFHDVLLRCRTRTVDGWDRTSTYTAYTAWTPLALQHSPAPPNLVNATWAGGTATVVRQVGDPNFADWAPDLVVQHDVGARVFIYRRKLGAAGRPTVASVTVGAPAFVSGNTYRVTVTGVGSLTPFDGGFLVVPPFKAMIRQLSSTEIAFDVGQGDPTLFSAGPADLQLYPLHLTLWNKVAEFGAHGLPTTLTFADPVAGPGETADVLSYHLRVIYLGTRVGPPSNTVQALRLPLVPTKPPPFSVELLGVDFYNRTMVNIRFTNPVTEGRYTVWWATGTPTDFSAKAVPGVMRDQAPYANRYLFDLLAIPLPQTATRTITVGVQRVTAGEGQSAFETVPVTLPALAP